MLLPIKLFKFWYLDVLLLFLRTWKNTLSFLEEDLAVGLMWRLLFTPLFHDSSFVGRILSFLFRLIRIFTGLSAYLLATTLIIVLMLGWFILPIVLFYPSLSEISLVVKALFVLGILLFIKHLLHPPKKVRQLAIAADIWQATNLKKENLVWAKLTNTPEVKNLLWDLEIDATKLVDPNLPLTDQILEKVLSLAKHNNVKYLTSDYFFVSIILSIPLIENQLLKINLTPQDFIDALEFETQKRKRKQTVFIWDEDFGVTHLKGINRGWLGAPTPALDLVSDDLTHLAAKSDITDFLGREKVVSEVVNVLSQDSNRNVILVGPAGAGKTTLARSIAKKIITGDAPPSLATKRLVSLDLSRLLSGVTVEGELAEKVKNVFEEIQFVQNIIVYVDEIQNLGIGDAATSFNLYSLMMPYLESDTLQFLGSTEPENYAKILEKNQAFARLFTKIELPPADIKETKSILQSAALDLEFNKGVKVSLLAVKTIVDLSSKLIHDRVLPDAALSVFSEVKPKAKDGTITSIQAKEVIGLRVNVPIEAVGTAQKQELLNLETKIHQKMIDQEEAVKAVSDTLRRAAISLREYNRPIGSFLFVGPTGVGKTELAKTLSEIYFKGGAAFVRFDMSEYQSSESINRLIGTISEPGELTEAIKNKPYALVLLDEFEKATPQILNLFLQVLEDGRLTDASGKHIDFTNTIIIATSNAASLLIAQGLQSGKSAEQLRQTVKDELLKQFRPELVNRFDDVIIFKPLSPEDLQKIVRIKLVALAKLLKEQGYIVEFDESLVVELAKKGFDPVLGARPLRRLIQDTLEAKLSIRILEGKLPKGQVYKVGLEILSA